MFVPLQQKPNPAIALHAQKLLCYATISDPDHSYIHLRFCVRYTLHNCEFTLRGASRHCLVEDPMDYTKARVCELKSKCLQVSLDECS
jgi:hypothetical protein